MAKATFRFYEELNDFLPVDRRKQAFTLQFTDAVPVRHGIETCGVPHTEIEVILVNGVSVDLEHRICDGDRISIYPVFESLDVTPLLRLRPRTLRDPRFLADAHLGRLAGYLRMLGFDTLFRNDWADDELARRAAMEHRILLTRDRALLMYKAVTHGCFVHEVKPPRQLASLLERLDLCRRIRPFSRCIRCNDMLENVERERVLEKVPPGIREGRREFFRCRGCGQVYWKGSHYARMKARIGASCPDWRESPQGDAD